MTKTGCLALSIVAVFCFRGALGQDANRPHNSLPQARVLGPGVLSTPEHVEFGACLSADERTIYFTRGNDIFISRRSAVGWSKPYVAPFCSKAFDGDPFLNHDESAIYFMSERPVPGSEPLEPQPANNWVVTRQTDGDWSEPRLIPPPVNIVASVDGFASLTNDGTMYFFSTRDGGLGSHDIYRSRLRDGHRLPPELLPRPINTKFGDGHPYISPDERFLVFWSNRPGGHGKCDLYISFRNGNKWTQPRNLGPQVNTELCDMTPHVNRDGTRLYFARIFEDGNRDLFVIEFAELLKSLEP